MDFTKKYLLEASEILKSLDTSAIEEMANIISRTRDNKGRIFFLGSGGSAANASHAVNDFRKLANIECYSPSDNCSELTARINDDGWKNSYSGWLKVSKINKKDALFLLSVGGGDKKKKISENLIESIKVAKSRGCKVLGIVGPNGGYTYNQADVALKINVANPKNQTPHTEAFHMVISHLLVSHPKIKVHKTKW